MLKIAVASKGFAKVSGHAGQAKEWLLFERNTDDTEWQVNRISLSKAQTFHHFKDDVPHPLDGISALITISAGDSFLSRMRKGGIDAVLTAETDPRKAVEDYLNHCLKPPKPRPIGQLICKLHDALSGSRH